jgi:hypothetical protein
VIKTQFGRATEKSFFWQVTIETFDSRIANASDDLGCGVTLAARMEAREGELPRADARLLFALQEAGARTGGTDVLPRARRYHSKVQQILVFLNFVL